MTIRNVAGCEVALWQRRRYTCTVKGLSEAVAGGAVVGSGKTGTTQATSLKLKSRTVTRIR